MTVKHTIILITYIIFCINTACSQVIKKQTSSNKTVSSTTINNGYSITINTKNLENEKLLLYFYYGIQKNKIIADSITIKANQQEVHIDRNQKVYGGIYEIGFENQQEGVQLALDNGAKVKLTLEHKSMDSIKCTESNLNRLFIDFQKNKNLTIEERTKFLQTITSKYPNSVLEYYLKLDVKAKTKFTKTETADASLFRTNYLKGIDLTDKRLFIMPNLYHFMNNMVISQPLSVENYNKTIDAFLQKLTCKDKTYANMVEWFSSNLAYNEEYNLENSFKYLFDKYINIKDCNAFKDNKMSEFRNKIQSVDKLPQGSTLADYNFIDKDSTAYSIKDLYSKANYTMFVFFSPSCHHCIEYVPKNKIIWDALQKQFPQLNLQLVTILNDSDQTRWGEFIANGKLENTLNLKDKSPNMEFQDQFNAHGNPNYILVNQQGKILLKSFNLKALYYVIANKN